MNADDLDDRDIEAHTRWTGETRLRDEWEARRRSAARIEIERSLESARLRASLAGRAARRERRRAANEVEAMYGVVAGGEG